MSLLSSLKSKPDVNTHDPVPAIGDAQLLSRFLREKSEQAFAEIVSRYGEMVFAVALRAVRHRQTAEDVTQATFLVLARDAKKIRHAGSLGAWLHGVALRLARKALKRCHREKVNDVVNELEIAQESFEEIHSAFEQQVLDEELQGLPDQYRDALVLHFLQGLTYEETAQQLGLTIGAVEGRIKRGKRELHLRLSKRGVGLTVALAAITWSQTAAAATVQPALVQTIAASGLAVFQGTAFPAACSSEAVHLAAKELTMFTAAKMTMLTCGLMLAAGAGWAAHAGVGDDETGSSGGFGDVGTVVDEASDSDTDASGDALIAQQTNPSDEGLSGGGIISGDGTSGLISQGSVGGGAGYGVGGGYGDAGGYGVGAAGSFYTSRGQIVLSPSELTAREDGLKALSELRLLLKSRKEWNPSDPQNGPTAVDEAISVIDQAVQALQRTEKHASDTPTAMRPPGSTGMGEMMSMGSPGDMAGMSGMPGRGGPMGSSMAGQVAQTGKPVLVSRTISPQEQKIADELDQVTQFEFPGNPLRDVIDFIAMQHDFPILLDETHMNEEGVSPDEETELVLSGVTLKSALHLLLDPLGLDYIVEDDVLKITTKTVAEDTLETRIYDVRSMNIKRPEALADVIVYGTGQDTWSSGGGKGEISFLNGSVIIRQTARVHDEVEKLLENLAKIELANQNSPQWPAKNRPPQSTEEEGYGMGMMGPGSYGGDYAGMGYGQSYRGSWDNVQPEPSSSGAMSGYSSDGAGYESSSK